MIDEMGQARPVQQPPQQPAPFSGSGKALGKRIEENNGVTALGKMAGQVVGKDPGQSPFTL